MKHLEERLREGDRLNEQRQLWIDTLSHARHDWLNDLQLIIGYVQLRKYDKLAGCVDMLKQRMALESRAAKLGHPGLVEALLTYRTKPRPFAFAFAVEESIDFRTVPQAADEVEFAVRSLLAGFEAAAAKGARGSDNELACTFGRTQAAATILFTYRGAYAAQALTDTVDAIRGRLETSAPSVAIEVEFGAEQAQVNVSVPVSG